MAKQVIYRLKNEKVNRVGIILDHAKVLVCADCGGEMPLDFVTVIKTYNDWVDFAEYVSIDSDLGI